MLNVMRDTLKYSKWILILIVISFVLFYGVSWWDKGGSRGRGAVDASWVARVDGENIDVGTWQMTSRNLEDQYRRQFGQVYEQLRKSLNLRQQAADQLIVGLLVRKDAHRLGFAVSDKELSAAITSMPIFQRDGGFIGADAYQNLFRTGALAPFRSALDFEAALRDDLMSRKWQEAMASSVVVGNDQVEQEFRRRHEKVNFEYVALPIDRAAETAAAPSDAELESYYRAHADRFGSGEGRHVEYVLFDDTAAASRATVSDKEIEDYYQQHQSEFNQPEQRHARHILLKVAPNAPQAEIDAAQKKAADLANQAKSGADFAKLAAQYSQDEGSKVNGGDLGTFPQGRMVPEFDQAVFSMQPGQVSDPVRTSFGFHVIKLEGVQPAGQQPLANVKEQIRGMLRFPRLREAAAAMAKEFRAKVKTPADMRRVAGEMKLTLRDAGTLLRTDQVPGIGPAPGLLDAAFALQKDAVSDVVDLPRGAAVVTVSEIVPQYTPPFAARRERVLAEYRQDHAKDAARAKLASAVAKAGGDLAKAAKELKLEVKKTDAGYTRGAGLPGVGADPALDQVAFSTAPGSTSSAVATEQAAVVVHVTGREQANVAELAKEESDIRDALRAPLASEVIRKKIEGLRKSARIEYNESLLKNSEG